MKRKRLTVEEWAEAEALRLRLDQAKQERLGDGARKVRKAVTDESPYYMTGGHDEGPFAESPATFQALNSAGCSLNGLSIIEEIKMEREQGKVRPFVEGEPIGYIQLPRAPARQRTHDEEMEYRRASTLALRAENNRRMQEVLGE